MERLTLPSHKYVLCVSCVLGAGDGFAETKAWGIDTVIAPSTECVMLAATLNAITKFLASPRIIPSHN